MRISAFVVVLGLALTPVRGAALPLPDPKAVADPAERALLPRLAAVFHGEGSKGAKLASLDQMLVETPRPTPLRGLIQFLRAQLLEDSDRSADAVDAITESVRLLPRYSAPLLVASQIHAYTDQPDIAADYLLRAAGIDPMIVNSLGDYEVNNILTRLDETNDERRAELVSASLLDARWSRGDPATLSGMARRVLEARLDHGDVDGAAAMVPRIVLPRDFARLLTESKFQPLRGAVEAWAGAGLEKAWPIYLEQARGAWQASADLDAGHEYAKALAAAGHDDLLVATFLPRFAQPIDRERDFRLIFIAPPTASALARLGRWDEALALFDKALTLWTPAESAAALNLSANRARMLVQRGDFEAGLRAFNFVVRDAARWGGEVNIGALTSMHAYRACALAQLGRADDMISAAIVAERRLADPTTFAWLQLCEGDVDAARNAYIEALAHEPVRDDVIEAVQPSDEETFDSDFARLMEERQRRLKADPVLIEAVAQHGRILPQPLNARAPPERTTAR